MPPIPPDNPQHSAANATNVVLRLALLSDEIIPVGVGEFRTILPILCHRFLSVPIKALAAMI
jgi:hypothetical protein